MASDVDSPPSRLGSDPVSDPLPLAERRTGFLRPPPPRRMEPSPPTPDRFEASPAPEGTGGAASQTWPGLPRGVEFNPSDSDLVWHLAAEIGNGLAHRHPFISDFIRSTDEDGGFCCTHPKDIPGMRQDGHASYFFHKKLKLYNNENGKYICWQKSGASRSIILDGSLQGCMEVFVLYAFKKSDNSPQRTDWKLHQYHIKNTMEDEGELVVSKIFYKSEKHCCEWAAKAPVQCAQDDSVTENDSKEDNVEAQLENCSVNMATDGNFVEGDGNNQEQLLIEMYPDQDKLSFSKDVLDTTYINHENQINDHTETDLDHISLQERYRILLAEKNSLSAMVSAEKCVMNDSENTSRQMGAETSRYHEGTAYREDICSILQEISSAPPITDSMDTDNNMWLMGEIPQDNEISSMECLAGNNEIPHDPAEDTECPVNGKNLNSSVELLPSQTPTGGDENAHLAVRNAGSYLVDVKRETALEGYEINASEYPRANGTHAAGSPSLGVKSEVTGCEFPGLCENNSINAFEPIVNKTHARTLNHNGGLAYCSHQRKKRKIATDSSKKVLEEDAYRNDENIAYPSRRRRKKKTATDSIEKALEEDAPGLLQILMDRGIMVKEIKLYDVEEDDEMLPDCTESDFQDLENVITKLFPPRVSLLKSTARHLKGEKAIYCLACLISLIEQSRYLQFRDCPVEWGWCRDLQSFVFVFRSHNRLVLERPEYGYATYFFEIVQSVPIEWQIRRLVVAMKLSSCGRTALIENRPLLVGEDLTEGEAHVLEEYGWIPNTGLGTMLNYRDRVVHDRWNEKYSTDWKMKIGKLLMNGYSEGQLIITHNPLKLETLPEDSEDIKLEDPF
ncbi:uncharacterized protein LOC100826588 isoform X3 [Brachypodium distachyon]|uniref:NAC domain-containing protein n=1 Tax=Brachypodium distachyon TaxID=15368 RepID=A0A0Q3HIZ7_BRADI|nr:uncharacterized protein LOC100826588 isoform X3 [Brachypodium distachyon]KQK22840.1 hypothetical protein BRADI_1g69617v3 [Brachypodium distachyon]|eukprot:XP_010228959.1 uncharacterized protein LOC100826588 isoform X3 [Brachypodium distachyon]